MRPSAQSAASKRSLSWLSWAGVRTSGMGNNMQWSPRRPRTADGALMNQKLKVAFNTAERPSPGNAQPLPAVTVPAALTVRLLRMLV